MHVSLTPALEGLIRAKVESGLYNNASEVVREALRLLAAQDARLAPTGRRQTAAEILATGAAVAALPSVDPRSIAELREFVSTP